MSDNFHVLAGSPTIEDALTSHDETTRIIARASSSLWMQHFTDWLQDEVQRSDHITLLRALAQIQIMTHASIASGIVKHKSYPVCLRLYAEMLNRHYVEHAVKSAAASRAIREAGR